MKSALVIKDLSLGSELDHKSMSAVRGGAGKPGPMPLAPPDLYTERHRKKGAAQTQYLVITMEDTLITS